MLAHISGDSALVIRPEGDVRPVGPEDLRELVAVQADLVDERQELFAGVDFHASMLSNANTHVKHAFKQSAVDKKVESIKCPKHDEEKAVRYRSDGSVRYVCRACMREYKRDRYGYIGQGYDQERQARGTYRGPRDARVSDEVKQFALRWVTGRL